MSMSKGELIEAIYGDFNEKDLASKAATKRIVDAVFDKITEELAAGSEVRIDKFGTFSVGQRAAHNGVNPQTGEKITIPAKKTIKFKPATNLKDSVSSKIDLKKKKK